MVAHHGRPGPLIQSPDCSRKNQRNGNGVPLRGPLLAPEGDRTPVCAGDGLFLLLRGATAAVVV